MLIPLLAREPVRRALAPADAPELFAELRLSAPLESDWTVLDNEDGTYWVRGTVRGTQELVCSRSLEPFGRPFETEVEVLVKRSQRASEQANDDGESDVYEITVPGHQNDVDVTDAVRQMVLLQEPISPVKDPGADFAWHAGGAGEAEPESEIDPRWAPLLKLKNGAQKK
jgi:uncharacterized protein